MSSPATESPGRAVQVAWLASAYGFGDDLAYYRQVFREFVRRYAATVVHVDKQLAVEQYPELPLQADFEFRVYKRHRLVAVVKRWIARRNHTVLTSNRHRYRYLTGQLRVPDSKILVGPYLTSDPGIASDGGCSEGQIRLLYSTLCQGGRKSLNYLN
jgi:hypothetical protein